MVRDFDLFTEDGISDLQRYYANQFGPDMASEMIEEIRSLTAQSMRHKNLMIDFLKYQSEAVI